MPQHKVFLKKCENYQLAKEVIRDVANLCLGQYDNEMSDYLAAKFRKDKLSHDIVFDGFGSENKNIDKIYAFNDDDVIHNEHFVFIQWFNSIVKDNKTRNPIIKLSKNAYYYPPFITTFRRIVFFNIQICREINHQQKSPQELKVIPTLTEQMSCLNSMLNIWKGK